MSPTLAEMIDDEFYKWRNARLNNEVRDEFQDTSIRSEELPVLLQMISDTPATPLVEDAPAYSFGDYSVAVVYDADPLMAPALVAGSWTPEQVLADFAFDETRISPSWSFRLFVIGAKDL